MILPVLDRLTVEDGFFVPGHPTGVLLDAAAMEKEAESHVFSHI